MQMHFAVVASAARLLSLTLALAVAVGGCKRDVARPLRPPSGNKTGATVVHVPAKLTSIESTERDGLGRPVRVACITCHSTRTGGRFPERASDLRQFHVGLSVRHGTLGCLNCHVARTGGEPRLHLADGRELATVDSLELCAQCHGPKYQAYLHGAHGGMTGYWDLSQGDRSRNHCIDCHDPHAPTFAPTHPVLQPRDRFLTSEGVH